MLIIKQEYKTIEIFFLAVAFQRNNHATIIFICNYMPYFHNETQLTLHKHYVFNCKFNFYKV